VLCHYRGADLDNSPCRHFPRHPEGEMRRVIIGVQNLLNTRLVAQVGITAMLHTQMEHTAMELQQVRSQLVATRRENEALKATLQGVDPIAQAQDTADHWSVTHHPARGLTSALSTPPPLSYLRRNPMPLFTHIASFRVSRVV
jgi:hypothetical protein